MVLNTEQAEFGTQSILYSCSSYLQESGRFNQNEGATVFTTLYMYIDFSDAQEQRTLLSVVGSCQNTNSYMYKLLCMSSLRAKNQK